MKALTRSLSAALVLSSVFLGGASASTSSSTPVHLFILSGQSNMVAVKPDVAFLPEIHRLLPNAEVIHFKVAVSGEPIRYWLRDWTEIAAAAGLSPPNEKGPVYYDQILEQFEAVRSAHPRIDTVTLCWMQGERDAKTRLAAAYDWALTRFISNLRRDLGRPNLNVVIGRLSDHSPGPDLQSGWELVRRVQMKVSERDPHAAWVDTDDLNDMSQDGQPLNDLHNTPPDGYVTFAHRLARQSARLILGQAPHPSGRPTR